jgi:glycosyltransferase involved in cell wall biosynthesis
MPDFTPVVHVSSWVWSLGGVQSALAHHVARDERARFPAHPLSLFDREAPDSAAMAMRLRAWDGVAFARRQFSRLVRQVPTPRMVVYHDAWGLRWWADRDGAHRRLAYLHTEVPHLETRLRELAPRVDGVLVVNRSMRDRLRRAVPEFPAERCFQIPYFVSPPEAGFDLQRQWGSPWRLGFAGRLERAHKRVDRLPAIISELDRRGIDYRFEILGTGSERANLERVLGEHPRVTFCGQRTGEAYWQTLAQWDCLILPSDFEGFGRVVMEGMMVGVMPVMPDYSPAAGEVLGPLAQIGVYPVGEVANAVDCVERYARLGQPERESLRSQARDRFADHTATNYDRVYGEALEQVLALPPRGQAAGPMWWEPWLPLGLHTRLFPDRF